MLLRARSLPSSQCPSPTQIIARAGAQSFASHDPHRWRATCGCLPRPHVHLARPRALSFSRPAATTRTNTLVRFVRTSPIDGAITNSAALVSRRTAYAGGRAHGKNGQRTRHGGERGKGQRRGVRRRRGVMRRRFWRAGEVGRALRKEGGDTQRRPVSEMAQGTIGRAALPVFTATAASTSRSIAGLPFPPEGILRLLSSFPFCFVKYLSKTISKIFQNSDRSSGERH